MVGVTFLEVSNLITTAVFPNNLIRSAQTISTCLSVPLEKIRKEFTEYVNSREKHKSCRTVVGAANYSTLFGVHSIPDTAERLVLFQLLHVSHWPTHTLQVLPTYREC